jgi:surface carbohydrate biosynthesis protein
MKTVILFFIKIQLLLTAKWYFSIPSKKKIILYDYNEPDLLSYYLKKNDTYLLETRLKQINIYILFKSLIRHMWRWKFFSGYIVEYIKEVNPKLVITFIDNNPQFYQLKIFFPNTIIAFVQNGMRGHSNDIFGMLESGKMYTKNFAVDKMFVWNNKVGEMYKKYLGGNYYTIGSLKNNHAMLKRKKKQKKNILFLSEFRPTNPTEHLSRDYYAIEKKLIPFLYNFCQQNSLTFEVCANLKNSIDESNFYKNLIPGKNWKFLERKNQFSSYYYTDNALVTIFISTALGFESIARGNKTGAFALRYEATKIKSHKLGWPFIFSENGKTWTQKYNERIFKRILTYLISSPLKTYQVYQRNNFSKLITRTEGNKKFLSLIN